MVFTDSCFAESINEHVFTTITSASSASEVICAPARSSRPIMTSLSTRFLGQPRLTKPILVLGEVLKRLSSVFTLGLFQWPRRGVFVPRFPRQNCREIGADEPQA